MDARVIKDKIIILKEAYWGTIALKRIEVEHYPALLLQKLRAFFCSLCKYESNLAGNGLCALHS